MESPSCDGEAAVCGGGRASAGPAHAGSPQLQVPATQTETGQED